MIEVKNLSKSFGEKGVLLDLNFSVAHGQSVAIVGKSGAGKSVLLKWKSKGKWNLKKDIFKKLENFVISME